MKAKADRRSWPGDGKRGGSFWLGAVVLGMALILSAAGCDGGDDGDDEGSPVSKGGLSGRLNLPARLLLDTDTADPNNPQASNDDPAHAQPLANLSTVSGHASQLLDPEDYFSCLLSAGEQVVLRIADSGADFDLYLYQGAMLVDSSTSAADQVERVTVPADGNYLIRVNAFLGESIYTLDAGIAGSAVFPLLAAPAWSEDDEFVIGEAIVKFRSGGPAAPAGGPGGWRAAAEEACTRRAVSLQALDPRGLGRVRFEEASGIKKLPAGRFPSALAADPVALRLAKKATLDKIRELNSDPAVAYAEPNFIVHPVMTPNDSYYSLQWNLRLIHLPEAWDHSVGGNAVVVAVVDTGLLYNHPDLAANVLKDGAKVVGYDMISDPQISRDGDAADPDPYDNGDRAFGNRSSFHGSHVAGIAAAATNNSMGIAGVGWQIKIMPVRVLGEGGGTYYDVAQGIYYAAGLENAYPGVLPRVGGVVTAADIINLSLGSSSGSGAVEEAIAAARAAGVIVIAAAGNEASSAPFYPAAYRYVVGVSAVDLVARRSYYSNFGSYVDLAAPGGDLSADLDRDGNKDGIYSTVGNDLSFPLTYTYEFYQGTSMAAPHVAGVAALMKTAFKAAAPPPLQFTPQNFDDLIQGREAKVDSITDYPRGYRENNKGYGMIDAEKAVLAALILAGETVSSAADLSLQPRDLAFGLFSTTLLTYVTNRGMEPLAGVTVLPYSMPWLSHQLHSSPLSITFSVDRQLLADGSYTASVTVSSENGGTDTATISVIQQTNFQSNAGTIYVILFKPSADTSAQTTVNFTTGYFYTLSGVRVGDYFLAAGTDLDNDGYIGDNGELFGMYPDLDHPLQVSIVQNTTLVNRNFSLQFIGLPPASAEEQAPAAPRPRFLLLRSPPLR